MDELFLLDIPDSLDADIGLNAVDGDGGGKVGDGLLIRGDIRLGSLLPPVVKEH